MITARRWVRAAVGVLLVTVLLWYAGFREVGTRVLGADSNWLLAACICLIVSTLLGSYSAFLLISRDHGISFPRFLPIFWTAWALGLVVPGQVGDIAGTSLMLRRHGYDWHRSLGRSLVDKAISLVVMTVVAVFGAVAVLHADVSTLSSYTLLGLVAASATGGLMWFLWLRPFVRAQKPGFLGLLAQVSRESLDTATSHPIRVTLNLVLTLCKIGVTGFAYWCAFRAVGHSGVRVLDVIPLVALSSLIAYLPISLNGLGTAEVGGVALFGALNVPSSTVLAAYLLLRAMVVVLAGLPAGALYALRKPGAG